MKEQKIKMMQYIKQAVDSGARQSDDLNDGRLTAKKNPKNSLSELEIKSIIKTANKPEYASLTPAKIVPLWLNWLSFQLVEWLIIALVVTSRNYWRQSV